MSEHDAHHAMLAAANLRLVDDKRDPNEAEPMTFCEKQRRAREARELRHIWLNVDWIERQMQRNLADLLGIKVASGDTLDVLANWPVRLIAEPTSCYGMRYHGDGGICRNCGRGLYAHVKGACPRLPDFRDGDRFDRGVAGMHQRAQRDGFPSDDVQ